MTVFTRTATGLFSEDVHIIIYYFPKMLLNNILVSKSRQIKVDSFSNVSRIYTKQQSIYQSIN
jgi:hypothetical protein